MRDHDHIAWIVAARAIPVRTGVSDIQVAQIVQCQRNGVLQQVLGLEHIGSVAGGCGYDDHLMQVEVGDIQIPIAVHRQGARSLKHNVPSAHCSQTFPPRPLTAYT